MAVSLLKTAEPGKTDKSTDTPVPAKRTNVGNELLRGVRVSLEARLGQASMTVEDMMALKPGSVVTLQTSLADHVELYLNDTLVARGEIVAVGDKYGVRIAEIAST
jgi:flagellar motor switch protein FliN/FliY